MKVPARQLERHLAKGLAHVYLIAGDEPLLVDEALEQVRRAARAAGFDGREAHFADRGFRWDEFESGADELSLFASRKVVEIRMPSPKPGDVGSRTLSALAKRADPDRILVVVAGEKLGTEGNKAAWVKSIESHGVLIEAWPIERAELPEWLKRRAQKYRLTLDTPAAELLAERVEGNLLAGDQELKRLELTRAGTRIGAAEVEASVGDNSRFDVFRLTDAVAAGTAARAFRILAGLRAEGVAPALINWALGREILLLARLEYSVRHGASVDDALRAQRVWSRRYPLVKQALKRYSRAELTALVRRASQVDAAVKGALPMPAWEALTGLLLLLLQPQGRA